MTCYVRVLLSVALLVGCAACDETRRGPRLEVQHAPPPSFEAAAGSPAYVFDELDTSPAMDEARSLDELMALGPEALGAELPEDLVIEKKIVGVDGRKPIADTTIKPYSTIAMLLVMFPKSAAPGLCTGSLIASDAVLTAGHCVFNASKGGWATSMRVVPGVYPDAKGVTQRPFGSASALRSFAPAEYRSATTFWGREPHDYAVVRFGKGIAGASTRAYDTMAIPAVALPVKLVGYHGDKCFGAAKCSPASSSFVMHTSSDSIRAVLESDTEWRVINHYADSYGGASGAPLISNGAFANTIFAVHVAGLRDDDGSTWTWPCCLRRRLSPTSKRG